MAVKTIPDPWLFVTTGVLTLGGVLMVGTSSRYVAMRYWNEPGGFFWKQLLFVLVGVALVFLVQRFRYSTLADRRLLLILFLCCVGLLILVLFMPPVGGARRWIPIGPFRFQPSEFVKLFVVVFVASMLARKGEEIDDPWRLLFPCLSVVATLALLILIEPDLGSTLVIGAVVLTMFFVAGLRWRHLGALSLLTGAAATLAVILEPFRWRRFVEYVLALLGLAEPSYQVQQSWIALGRGGPLGVGLGQGHQQAFFLPAPHTDFIYSVVGEELGLLGTLGILAGFLLIFWRGVRTVVRTTDPFGAYLALGLTSLLVGEALLHMSVCVGLVPPTGLALPFISYGGSSLVASLLAVALLLNVSKECNIRA